MSILHRPETSKKIRNNIHNIHKIVGNTYTFLWKKEEIINRLPKVKTEIKLGLITLSYSINDRKCLFDIFGMSLKMRCGSFFVTYLENLWVCWSPELSWKKNLDVIWKSISNRNIDNLLSMFQPNVSLWQGFHIHPVT